jgi:signal transduction histidine kinase
LLDTGLTVGSYLDRDEVLEAAYRRIQDVWDPPGFLVALYRQTDDTLDYRIYVHQGVRLEPFRRALVEEPGLAGWIARSREPLLIRDWDEEADARSLPGRPMDDPTRSWVGVPLLVADRLVGVMAVQHHDLNAYGREHQRFLSSLAAGVAIAIENVRLYQQAEQYAQELAARSERLALVNRISMAVSSTVDLDEILHTATRELADALHVTRAGTILFDQDADVGRLVAEFEDSPATPQDLRIPLSGNLALEQVIATQQALAISDVGSHPQAAGLRELLMERDVKSALIVPLVVQSQVTGTINLEIVGSQHIFAPEEIDIAQTIANQVAAALENANLYEGVKRADEARSEFIDFVAHELKQPMTAMQGYAKMLMMGIGGELTDTQKQFVEVISDNVHRMGKLVNDLLEISRLEAGRTKLRLRPVQMGALVEETVTSTRTEIKARHQTLEVEIPPALPPVMGDRDRLAQVLTNLVSNAYKYTPEGGTIRIAVDRQCRPQLPANHLCVQVIDTGIGMTPQEIGQLEEKFFRGSHDLVQEQTGTGLGMSIVRNLVALHRGEFLIESEPGQGSTFIFSVPIAELAAGPDAGPV